jgi:hypothetical protein
VRWTRGIEQGDGCAEAVSAALPQADQRRAGYTEPAVPLKETAGPTAGGEFDNIKVPEGLKASPSGGPDGSTTSHGTRTAYRSP